MSEDPIEARVAAILSRHVQQGDRIGVAVSGGSDSVALMHLAALWARRQGAELQVATVDHGLREGAAAEAEVVGEAARNLSLQHCVLPWRGWDGTGNLQDAARAARRTLLARWAREQNLSAVLLGHTQDDQAETFLIRLGRGSGVDGLAAMSEVRSTEGISWVRPLLEVSRDALQGWLRDRDVSWIADPSNEDEKFARVRVRKAAGMLAELGLDAPRLAATAASMARARAALAARAHDQAMRLADVTCGVLHFQYEGLAGLEAETRLRLIAHGLQWTASQPYRPRLTSLEGVWAQVQDDHPATLHGCLLGLHEGRVYIAREYAVVAGHDVAPTEVWDQRWQFAPGKDVTHIAPLGEAGLRQVHASRFDLPRFALLSLPGLWAQDDLVAVPALSWGVSAEIYTLPSKTSFLAGLIAH